jgi:hypothetical protein
VHVFNMPPARSKVPAIAAVRCTLRLPAPQVLELYQVPPFVLQLNARAAPVAEREAGWNEVSVRRLRMERERARAQPNREGVEWLREHRHGVEKQLGNAAELRRRLQRGARTLS